MKRFDVHSNHGGASNDDGDAPVAMVDKMIKQQGIKHHNIKAKLEQHRARNNTEQIHDWRDSVRVFVGNFLGTYVRPGNSWDLKSCRQGPDESLRDFIRCFSKKCTELPSVGDSEIV